MIMLMRQKTTAITAVAGFLVVAGALVINVNPASAATAVEITSCRMTVSTAAVWGR